MQDSRNETRSETSRDVRPTQYRLAWRYRTSGREGRGPWMGRPDVIEAWVESLNPRSNGDVLHWLERSD